MLGVASMSSSSSSSSSELLASESIPALPPPIPDLSILSAMVVAGSVLLIISEMLELDAAQHTLESKEMRPPIGTSIGIVGVFCTSKIQGGQDHAF
jgi:hypothetical protein